MVKDRFRLSGTFVACRVPQAHGSLSGAVGTPCRPSAPSRARGALRSPSPEAPRRRARRRVAARGRGHWCRRRGGGCPTARDVRPNEGLGDGAPSWALPLLRRHPGEFPEVTPHERSRRHAHIGQSTLPTSSPSPSPAPPPSSPPQCCPVRRGSARRHGEQPVMGCN